VPEDPRFAQWRERQTYRANIEVGAWPSLNPHIPASYKLSRGCSVGCWFSRLPSKLEDMFLSRHDAESCRQDLRAQRPARRTRGGRAGADGTPRGATMNPRYALVSWGAAMGSARVRAQMPENCVYLRQKRGPS